MNTIVIVGGGTAGWMAALSIADRFPDKRVIVVDSKVIGPIGVGESVTGVVLELIADPLHRLSMGEFFRRCNATFKMGIWYKDWQGPGTDYRTPIDAPFRYFKHHYETETEEFYARVACDGVRLGDVQIYSHLMAQRSTDHLRNPDGSIRTDLAFASCHFDALKFAEWMQEVAGTRPNITHYDDIVVGFEQSPQTGHVKAVHTRDQRTIAGDFFIDCTGFHRLLFAKAYQPKWRSYRDYIKVDSAIPHLMPHAEGEEIPSYTESRAMPHGWMWQIPTQSRRGRGYIYSSRYVSDEQAIADFRAAGVDAPDNPRILRFDPGRFETQWEGNVCTIGISGVFSEPLESTTIHGMTVQLQFLTELFLPFCTRESLPAMAAQYNRLVATAYDDYVDFISFHYRTGRTDTEFWRDYQKPEALTPTNAARLEKWRYAFPSREDFAPIYTQKAKHTTGLVVWAPMLCGLGLLRPEHAHIVLKLCRNPQRLQENVQRYIQVRNHVLSTALPHSEAIAHFRKMP